jgi:hypothetical protein
LKISGETMTQIKVVRVNKAQNNFTHYIDRAWAGLLESPFHNPFHVGKDGTRREVLEKFAAYWYAPERLALRRTALIMIQDGDILGCWCRDTRAIEPTKDLYCHGDIIAGYLAWRRAEETLF